MFESSCRFILHGDLGVYILPTYYGWESIHSLPACLRVQAGPRASPEELMSSGPEPQAEVDPYEGHGVVLSDQDVRSNGN